MGYPKASTISGILPGLPSRYSGTRLSPNTPPRSSVIAITDDVGDTILRKGVIPTLGQDEGLRLPQTYKFSFREATEEKSERGEQLDVSRGQ